MSGLQGMGRFEQLQKMLLDLPAFLHAGWAAQFMGTPLTQYAAIGHILKPMQIGQRRPFTKAFENSLPEALVVNFSTRHQGTVQVEDKDLFATIKPFP
jgi:hypothetical protein